MPHTKKSLRKFEKEIEKEWLDYDRSFSDEEREIKDFKDLETDTLVNEWGRHGIFELVGNGEQTSSKCGQFIGFKGCLNMFLKLFLRQLAVNLLVKVKAPWKLRMRLWTKRLRKNTKHQWIKNQKIKPLL